MKSGDQQKAGPRLRGPGQGVALLQAISPEDFVAESHPARLIWRLVRVLDWEGYEDRIRARGSVGGRAALDPRALMSLWIYGMSQGVCSARELSRRCESDLAYRWLLGGETTNHHSLSDFLRASDALLEDLFSQVIGCLHESRAVSFDTLLVDGTKVRGRAGSGSFHDEAGLDRAVRKKLSALRARGAGESSGERAARARAERELLARGDAALAKLRARQGAYHSTGRERDRGRASRAEVSLSDADARRMRGADGGTGARVNIQLGVCGRSGAVLSVGASSQANDAGLAVAAARGMERLCGRLPRRLLADGGYPDKASIAALAGLGVLFYAPPRKSSRRAGLGKAARAFHARWAARGSWARELRWRVEGVIGQMKGRGLWRIPLFGLAGARRWALWQGMTHNLLLLLRGG